MDITLEVLEKERAAVMQQLENAKMQVIACTDALQAVDHLIARSKQEEKPVDAKTEEAA